MLSVTDDRRGRTAQSDKSRWVARARACAALRGEIDLAVHSAKDVPGELAEGLALHGAPHARARRGRRCAASTALERLAPAARAWAPAACAARAAARGARGPRRGGASAATSTRACASSPTPTSVSTRSCWRAPACSDWGARPRSAAVLDAERFVPAPGQGILALEGRADDDAHARGGRRRSPTTTPSRACSPSARSRASCDANCDTPLGAYAVPAGGGGLRLRAWIGLPDGSRVDQRRAARRAL